MRTGKWYPTVADLQTRLAAAGWRTETVRPAPTLRLDADELGLRYGLGGDELAAIQAQMAEAFAGTSSAFRRSADTFQADLHYRLFVCRAMPA